MVAANAPKKHLAPLQRQVRECTHITFPAGGGFDNSFIYHTGPLGSSKYFPPNVNANGWYIGSDYCPYNPGFCTWNHIFDPYCSQDLHSGQRVTNSSDTFGFYFAGHLILENILDDAEESYDLKGATDIILSGVSAGGLGTWMNVDYIQSRYPQARVTAMTVAGFYFYATYYTGANHTDGNALADFREAGIERMYGLYDAYVDQSCKVAMEKSALLSAYPCMLANYSYPYVSSASFVTQSQTDKVVLTYHDRFPTDTILFDQPDEHAYLLTWVRTYERGSEEMMVILVMSVVIKTFYLHHIVLFSFLSRRGM